MNLASDAVAAGRAPRRIRLSVARAILSGFECGRITVVTPEGDVIEHRGHRYGPEATIILRNWRCLRRLLLGGSVGFAKGYIDGDWTSPDLPGTLGLAALNVHALCHRFAGLAPVRVLQRTLHLLRANTRSGSRRNVSLHYDLGNAFYAKWLDARMIYSSGVYDKINDTLELAQRNKLDKVLHLLALSGQEKTLEIGCGWGALACDIARAGSKVTAVTLSRKQCEHAYAAVAAEGLSERVAVRLQDYREVDGLFDRIVSIEMLEAVGEAYWPVYFATLRRRLAPGGRIVLQSITIAENRFERYRRGADFIQTYIFPGGMLPTKTAIADHARHAGLRMVSSEFFGESYARTLFDWRRRFIESWPEIKQLGFTEKFRQIWDYYLCYCAAGFRAGTIDVGLYVFESLDSPRRMIDILQAP